MKYSIPSESPFAQNSTMNFPGSHHGCSHCRRFQKAPKTAWQVTPQLIPYISQTLRNKGTRSPWGSLPKGPIHPIRFWAKLQAWWPRRPKPPRSSGPSRVGESTPSATSPAAAPRWSSRGVALRTWENPTLKPGTHRRFMGDEWNMNGIWMGLKGIEICIQHPRVLIWENKET